jgi:arylsulfatase A-like enzyme
MIRTPRYKYVWRYPNGPHDLFDLQTDPGEIVNLAGRPDMAEMERDLLAELQAWYAVHEDPAKSGLRVKQLPQHNTSSEAWRDGLREQRGLQVY